MHSNIYQKKKNLELPKLWTPHSKCDQDRTAVDQWKPPTEVEVPAQAWLVDTQPVSPCPPNSWLRSKSRKNFTTSKWAKNVTWNYFQEKSNNRWTLTETLRTRIWNYRCWGTKTCRRRWRSDWGERQRRMPGYRSRWRGREVKNRNSSNRNMRLRRSWWIR